jgi:glycosyltransferase involved in cell wall biosynthesis
MELRSKQTSKTRSVSVIIPTLNEESTIGQLLRLIPYEEIENSEIIIVDGGSSDGTVEIARALGVSVKTQKEPGYGHALIEAMSYAKGDILVIMDGDGIYDPREIPRLLRLMKEENADLVIGSRIVGEVKPGALPKIRLLANILLSLSFSLVLGTRITDAFSGFMIARKRAISRIKELPEPLPEPIQYAVIAEVYRRGGKIVEAPVTFYPRIGRSKLSPINRNLRVFLSFFRLAYWGGP